MNFAERAGRLAGMAGAVLGWPPDRFWAATPAELAAVVRAVTGEAEAPVDAATLGRMREACPDG